MKKVYLVLIACVLCLTGCGKTTYSNHEPDDTISEAICAVVDNDDIYYQGKSVTENNVVYYEYLIIHEEYGQIEQIIEAVNKALEEPIYDKINIDCWVALPGGAGRVVNLMNYSDKTLEKPDYNKLQGLLIVGHEQESIYNEPGTYVNIKDIRKLEISWDIQRKAEAEGIDWYEYWPDLESVETY